MLPNSDEDKIKVYPNEYINNITVNRGILRLLANDLYLESIINNIPVEPPEHNGSTGYAGQWAVDSNYVYFCISDHNWGRVALDTSF